MIHWGVMDGNEAALRILFSKDLCKAISNVLLKTNIALKKKELKVFGLWTFSDKITQKKLALPASLTPHNQASFSSASAYPHCQQPHLHACSVNQQHTHWELLPAKGENLSPVHSSGLRFTLVTSKFQKAQRIGFRPRISNRQNLAPH